MVVEVAASEQPGPPAPAAWGELYLREVVVRMAVLSSLLLPLAVPLPSLPPFLLLSSCPLPLAWRLERVSGGSGDTCCSWVSLLLGGEAGRVVVGLGEWLFVLECGVVQRAVEPLGMRDG